MKSVRIALYLSIILWFLRKLLMKLRGNYKTFRGSLRKRPGQPGYELFEDTEVPMDLALVMSVKNTDICSLIKVAGPYMICTRDARKIVDRDGFPRYHRSGQTNGLVLKFRLMQSCLLENHMNYETLIKELNGNWLQDEVKTFCDEGIAFMDRLFK